MEVPYISILDWLSKQGVATDLSTRFVKYPLFPISQLISLLWEFPAKQLAYSNKPYITPQL